MDIGDRVEFVGVEDGSHSALMDGKRGTVRFFDSERDDVVHVEFDGGLDWQQWPKAVLISEVRVMEGFEYE